MQRAIDKQSSTLQVRPFYKRETTVAAARGATAQEVVTGEAVAQRAAAGVGRHR